jgi:serine protease Do
VCVRVTDLRGVDLDRFSFDFDLTFAALVVRPKGPVLHRYGGRDHHSADARLSMTSLVRFMNAARSRFDLFRSPAGKQAPKRTLDEIPVWRDKMSKRVKKLDCYHCHYVFDAEREQKKADGTWTRAGIWRWPTPERIGLSLEVEELGKIKSVDPKGHVAKLGVRAGDTLLQAGGQAILTALDLSFVLENASAKATKLSLQISRGGEIQDLSLELPAGWKEGTALEFKWRPSKWQLSPRPGFGGRALSAQERQRYRLPSKGLAFRVTYIVDWGGVPDKRYGRAARKAGIKRGDIVVGVEGAEIEDPEHLHSWWRLTRKAGQKVVLKVIPKGKTKARSVELQVLPPK